MKTQNPPQVHLAMHTDLSACNVGHALWRG